MARCRLCLFASLLGIAAAAVAEEAGPALGADITVLELRANATAALLVQNRADSPVVLANCRGSYVVRPGENATLTLAGLSGFWLVPDDVAWDCHRGPFDLFYVAANLTGPALVASIGHGLEVGREAGGDTVIEHGATHWTGSVAGVEFTARPLGAANSTVRCRAGSCEQGREVSAMPEEFSLTIMGPQASLLSYWYAGWHGGGGAWHGGGYRYGGGGWGGGHWNGGGHWHGGGWGRGCCWWC